MYISTYTRNKKTVQYPHRLPYYEVPVDLREIVLYNEDLLHYAPVLDQVRIIRIFPVNEVNIEKVCPSVNCFWHGNEVYSLYEGKLSLFTSNERD